MTDSIFKRILLKLTSFKNLIVSWAIFIVTFIVAENRVDFNNVAMAAFAVIVAYLPANILQKVKTYKKEELKEE